MPHPMFRSVLLASLTLLASCGSVLQPTAPSLARSTSPDLSALAVNSYGDCPVEGCSAQYDVFAFAPTFLNAMTRSSVVIDALREVSGSADIYTALNLSASVVTSRWHWNSSSFQVVVPLKRDPAVVLRFEMVGGGSSSKTSRPRPFDTGLVTSSVMLGRMDHSPYGYDRVIAVEAQKRVAHTLILDKDGKMIGADVEVPLTVRAMAQALPVGNPRLSAQPIAIVERTRPLPRAQDVSKLTLDDIDPRCYQNQPNGGMSGQSIVVCPHPLPPRCPELDMASLAKANVTYLNACATPVPTPKPCPEVPKTLMQSLRNAEATKTAALLTMSSVTNSLLNLRSSFSQADCGSPNPVNKAKCVGMIGSLAFQGVIFAGGVFILKNAQDQVNVANEAIATWRSQNPCWSSGG